MNSPTERAARLAQRNELLALRRHLESLQERGVLVDTILAAPFNLPHVMDEIDRLHERITVLKGQLEHVEAERDRLWALALEEGLVEEEEAP